MNIAILIDFAYNNVTLVIKKGEDLSIFALQF